MAEEWFVGRNGQQSGPFSPAQLRQMAASGQVSMGDLVWKEGLSNWVSASSIRGLFPEGGQVPATPSARPGPRPVAPPPRTPLPSEGRPTSTGFQSIDSSTTGPRTESPAMIPAATGTVGPSGALEPADFLPRVGATLLDCLFLALFSCIPIGLLMGILVVANANNPNGAEAVGLVVNVCGNLISIVVGAIYYVALDSSSKQGTWGKQIVGLKVTDLQGRRIGAGRAIGRFLARYLSGCTCGIGFLLPLFTEKKQTLHDLICGCLVLKK
jgi:uncharacterized RDD family membrane protein YckC